MHFTEIYKCGILNIFYMNLFILCLFRKFFFFFIYIWLKIKLHPCRKCFAVMWHIQRQ